MEGKRITLEQRELMLNYMMKHPSLATNRFMAPDGAKLKQRLLNELTVILNSVANGVKKSSDKWLKSWQDWRSDTKAKAALLKREMKKTGGGTVKAKPLLPLEERLLSFLGPTVVSGHEEVLDPLLIGPASSSSSGNDTVVIDEGNCIVLPLDGPPEKVSFENMGALSPEPESPEFMILEETLPTSSSVPSPSVSRATSICNGNSAKKPVKRKHSTENVQEDIDLKMLKLSERQVKAAEDTLELQRKQVERQMDLQERQMDLQERQMDLQERQMDLQERQMDLQERQMDLQERQMDLQERQMDLQERQTIAMENASRAFIGVQERQTIAMENASRAIIGAEKVMEMFIKRQAGEGDVPGDQL